MARWRLMAAHYLNVPGIDWTYEETDSQTRRRVKKSLPVPLLLNPFDPADHNHPGEIIVCLEGKGVRGDTTFMGDPTPDMEPIDAEAEEISKSFRDKWKHPIESLPTAGDYTQSLLNAVERQMDAVTAIKASAQPNTSIDNAAFQALLTQVTELTKQNTMLLSRLGIAPVEAPTPEPAPVARRA